jgi:hypothetical protein
LWLSAARSSDGAFLSAGTTVYGMKDEQGDFMKLSQNWTRAEMNVFGNCCSSLAVFNRGSTIGVRIEADDGSKDAPLCEGGFSGTTGETNNLSFISAPANPTKEKYPSILFTQSNVAGGGPASCDAVAGL